LTAKPICPEVPAAGNKFVCDGVTRQHGKERENRQNSKQNGRKTNA
jgi:hypothetical protein